MRGKFQGSRLRPFVPERVRCRKRDNRINDGLRLLFERDGKTQPNKKMTQREKQPVYTHGPANLKIPAMQKATLRAGDSVLACHSGSHVLECCLRGREKAIHGNKEYDGHCILQMRERRKGKNIFSGPKATIKGVPRRTEQEKRKAHLVSHKGMPFIAPWRGGPAS